MAGRTWDGLVGSSRGHAERPGQVRLHPYHPRWALLIIVLGIFVNWALAAHGRDVATDRCWLPA
jgi:hypothetical protein